MKYKFENYNIEIVDPTIVRLQFIDEFGATKMPVIATLQTPDGSRFGGIDLGVFEYGETYEDADVMEWAVNQLYTFKA
jgi:hypothetical protein